MKLRDLIENQYGVAKKPQSYNDPNWAKKLSKEQLGKLIGPDYKKKKKEIKSNPVNEDDCKYGRYYCSTDKKWKCRQGPKQTRESMSEDSNIAELQILSKVKGKGSEPSRLPKMGREIADGEEDRYLGRPVSQIGSGLSVYRDIVDGEVNYHLFDEESRRAVLTVFGTRYPGNVDSMIISGLYASPDNPIRAAEFYRHLITKLGITLVSDRKQSPGGQRVWQQLERYPSVEVYAMDTRTGEILNIKPSDEEMYAIPSTAVRGRETKKIARDIRLVATAR